MKTRITRKVLWTLTGLFVVLTLGAIGISRAPNAMPNQAIPVAYAVTESSVAEKGSPTSFAVTETSVSSSGSLANKCKVHTYTTWRTVREATCTTTGQDVRICTRCFMRNTRTLPKIAHTYQKQTVSPTCTKTGYTQFTCTSCGYSYRSHYTAAGHKTIGPIVVNKATCTQAGRELTMCVTCGTATSKTLPKLGHSYKTTVVKATCTKQGYTLHTCTRCGSSYKSNYTRGSHQLGPAVTIQKATCTSIGRKSYACKNCTYHYDVSIPALGHAYKEVIIQPTCTQKGVFKNVCTRCNVSVVKKELPLAPHKFSEWKQVKAPTCGTAGQNQRICSCGKIETQFVAKLGHDLEHHPAQAASCGQKGWEAYDTCKRCNYSTFKDYIVIGHVMGKPYYIVEPTCTTDGIRAQMCLNCHQVVESVIIARGHFYQEKETPPSCTEDGLIAQRCMLCGDLKDEEVVPALGHNFGDWTVTKEATCFELGESSRSCERCQAIETKDIEKTEHAYQEEIVPSTCKEEGYTLHTCSVCSDSYKDNYQEKTEHTFGDWVLTKESTCAEAGEEKRTCDVCDTAETRETAKKGHNFTSEITPPTCQKGGYSTYTCTKCGWTEQGAVTDPIDHNYIETIQEATCTEEGYSLFTCDMCGDNYKDNHTPVVDHKWGDWIVTTQPSTSQEGVETRTCTVCSVKEERTIDKLVVDERIVAHYAVVDGQVIDIISGKVMENAIAEGEYFRGGKVVLPSSYERASIEMIMVYNRQSTDLPVGNGLSYYGGAFAFQEIANPSNWGMIKTPFGGGWIGTNFTLRPSLNYNKRVLDHGDSYWCLAFDKTESTHALQINDDYVEKAHWSNYINRTFTLSTEHQFKDFIVYADKLTKEEMAEHFAETGIVLTADNKTLVGRVENGITGLGSAFAYTKDSRFAIPEWMETNTAAGTYTVDDGNGRNLGYVISDYVEPILDVDNSKYESVHIIKKPETLPVEYKYALSAVPYPFNVNHDGAADQYDVSWSSSDESVALVIDGLIVPQRAGTVTITATLRGTEMSDSCTIRIVNHETADERKINISANYVSNNGNSFSDTDYEMTTRAIQDAISETHAAGYNHVVFPQINFYAKPIDTECYIPSGMTVEFPEGSAFYMMPSEQAKTDGYTYFRMGWGWWSCAVPTDRATAKTDENGKLLGYYCRDAHLIIDQYYGEFYKEDATMNELSVGANEYAWGCVLLSFGKRAEYCSVEIREANCPTGFFITMGGKGNNELVNAAGGTIAADKFVSGWLDDTGTIVENGNWISTPDFYTVSPGASNGMDTLHEYYMGEWEHNVITSTQRLYDILWFDENYELIQANRWQYVDEGYSNKPDGAKYFKISMQQSALPTGTDFYIGLYPDESSRFCEIKNTNIINGADGLASVVGATEACWIHDNYVSGDGLLSGACWSLDLEDGWQGMRGTVIERNIFRKYAYSQSHGEYRGPDSGILALSSGYNTFVVSNYLGSIAQSNYNVANTHVINNVVHSMYSGFTSGKPNEIRTKNFAHVYYNIMGQNSNAISANGVVYYYGNNIISTVNLW